MPENPVIHPQADAFSTGSGLIPHGAYADLVRDTSTAAWDRQGGLLKRRRSERKTWIFTGFYSKAFMAGFAIADAGYAANAFAYVYIPGEDLFLEDSAIVPFGFPSNFDPGLRDAWKLRHYRIRSEGSNLIASCSGRFRLILEVEMNNNGLSFMCPTVDRPFNFTYKNLCLNATAKFYHEGRTYEAEGRYGGLDFSKGYPPRKTRWNWALITGETSDGKAAGLNLFHGHNGKYENAAWIDGRRILLPDTTFEFDRGRPLDKQTWRMHSDAVDIRFTPSRSRKEKINLGLLSHDFIQPFGRFDGKVKEGETIHTISGYGPAEDHESLW